MSYRYSSSAYFDSLKQGGDTATRVLVGLNIATFVLSFLRLGSLQPFLTFSPAELGHQPWTLLTYPLNGTSGGLITLLFTCYWMWVVGGSLERSWSTPTFLRFFSVITVASALGLWVGYLLLRVPQEATGLFLPLSALTVAWCYLNPGIVVQFMLVLPLRARHLAWLTMALTVFYYGQDHPMMGFFALAGIGITILWLRGLPWADVMSPRYNPGKPAAARRPRGGAGRNPFEAISRWKRKRKFMRLWKNSGMPESEEDFELPPR